MVPLSEIIAALESGVSVNSEDAPAAPTEHGILKVSCVSDGHFYPRENKRVLTNEVHRLTCPVIKGDLLVTRANTFELIGSSGLVDDDYPNLYLPDKVWRVVLKERKRDCVHWLKHVLNSPYVRVELKKRATGTSGSMKNIPQSSFLAIKVNRPSLKEQERIARYLDSWDHGIRQVTDLIAAKLRFKNGLMQQLLTGKRRFKEFGSDPWIEYHLGDLFTERDETNCIALPLLSITADRGVIPRSDVDRKDTSNENKSPYKRIAPGDIGYNTMRMWQGVSAVSRYEGIISPAYTICIPGPNIDADFAGYLFKYSSVVHLFYRFSQGLVDDTLSLKFHHFSQIRVRIPSIKEQRRIGEVFSRCDDDISSLRSQLEALMLQKKGLMRKLLTGEVRVQLNKTEGVNHGKA